MPRGTEHTVSAGRCWEAEGSTRLPGAAGLSPAPGAQQDATAPDTFSSFQPPLTTCLWPASFHLGSVVRESPSPNS